MTDTVSLSATAAMPPFRVGRVISRTFELLFRRFPKFLAIVGIAHLPYLFLLYWNASTMQAILGSGGTLAPGAIGFTGVIMGLTVLVVVTISQGAVMYGTFQEMREQNFSIAESFSVVPGRLLPMLATVICMVIAALIGFLLLVVPGFMVLSAVTVAVPACLVELLGPFESIGRSAELTKGYRWRVFGLLFLLGLIVSLVQIVIIVPFFVFGHGWVSLLGRFIAQVVAGNVYNVALAVTYHDLRAAKEGIDLDRIVAVFA